MSNGPEHAFVAALAVGGAHVALEGDEPTIAPLGTAFVAGCWGSIPDWLEPAIHPNHRQICHSVLAGAVIAYGAYKAYKWRPPEPELRLLRWILLVAGGSYLVHLAMDGCTAKSIPLIGKLK